MSIRTRVLVGVVAALVGGLLPAIEAARAPPARALKAGDEQAGYRRIQSPWLLMLGEIPLPCGPVPGNSLFSGGLTREYQ